MSTDDFDARYQPIYNRLYTLAVGRGGYVSDTEADQHGLGERLLPAALARGAIVRVGEGALRLAIFEPSRRERLIATWLRLGTRGVFSSRSALALFDLCEPGDTLHLTYPPDMQEDGLDPGPGVVLRFAEIPCDHRAWPAGLTATTAQIALRDAERDGFDAAVLVAARAKALRRKLVAADADDEGEEAPELVDPALRLAVLGAVDVTTRFSALDDAALADWASTTKIPAEYSPLRELCWSPEAELWRAVVDPALAIIRDLAGIGFYSALRRVDLRKSRIADLSPLVDLADLQVLHLGITAEADLTPLLECESLRRVRFDGFDEAAHGPARDELEAQGVRVDRIASAAPAPAPFADPALKLAVLEALSAAGAIELPELIAIDELELDAENLAVLLAIELTTEQLATVSELAWSGGGMALQHAVWPQFSGEEGAFDVRSLRGIEALSNLQKLTLEHCAVETELEAEILDGLRARGVDVVIR